MNHTVQAPKNGGASVKKKRRFNFVDFLVILLILAIIAGVIYLVSPASFLRQLASIKTGTLTYTVEIIGVDEEYLNMIAEGDAVGDAATKNSLGSVESVDYSVKQTELGYKEGEDGVYEGVLNEHPDRYNVQVTITATAEYVPDEGYRIDGTRIAVGESMALRFPDFVCEGYCISVAAENFN